MLLPLAVLFKLATTGVSAQSTANSVFTNTYPAFPTGVSSGETTLEGTAPLVCDVGCWIGAGLYPSCFVNQTLPDGSRQNQTLCDAQFCDPTTFNTFSQCLNCIIANGGERPFGYPLGAPLDVSTVPPPSYPPDYPQVPKWIDTTVANEMLKNVSDRCSSINRALTTGLTVTATATTTGPYNTTWTSGETRSMPQWTGLSGYEIPNVTNTFTIGESSGSASPTSRSSISALPSSGSPAAASAPSSTTARSSAAREAVVAPLLVTVMLLAAGLGSPLAGQ